MALDPTLKPEQAKVMLTDTAAKIQGIPVLDSSLAVSRVLKTEGPNKRKRIMQSILVGIGVAVAVFIGLTRF
jgi:hypothetical protein